MLRITIEQDDRIGASPQIQTFTVPDQAQARDGGGAPPTLSVLRHRAMKEPAQAQASTSIPYRGKTSARDAGSAPRVLLHAQAMRGATVPVVPASSGIVKPSDGGAAPSGKA